MPSFAEALEMHTTNMSSVADNERLLQYILRKHRWQDTCLLSSPHMNYIQWPCNINIDITRPLEHILCVENIQSREHFWPSDRSSQIDYYEDIHPSSHHVSNKKLCPASLPSTTANHCKGVCEQVHALKEFNRQESWG